MDGISTGIASSNANLQLAGLTPGVYRISVKGSQSGCIWASEFLSLTVLDGLPVGGSITGGTTFCSGSTSGLLSLSGNTGTVLKWQSSVSPFSSWIDISNTSTTYTSGELSESTQFRAMVQNGGCASTNSFPVCEITGSFQWVDSFPQASAPLPPRSNGKYSVGNH